VSEREVVSKTDDKRMTVEGEPAKRYGVSYGGEVLGSWDTAKEAWENYQQYEKVIRPVTDRAKKYRYSFRDGREEITIAELRQRVKFTWTCEICGQVVERRPNGKPLRPVQVLENCKLKDHYVGDECITYRDLTKAKELAKSAG